MLFDSSTPQYARATRPHNASTTQAPRFVAVATRNEEVADVLALAGKEGLVVVPQGSGHGAGAAIGADSLLLDTSRLDSVSIDSETRTATVGSGATWAAVNAAAEQHGLLGLAGSAPSVSVSGYTFAGGIGWLVRRDGLASGALRRVQFADGLGRLRTAADDATDGTDRDAIWTFRGGGGAGIATELEIDLFPTPNLHAGKLLWHGKELDAVVDAWARSLDSVGDGVASSIAVLHVPPLPMFPQELHGTVAVHLAVADPDGAPGAAPLLSAVRTAVTPIVDDWGPADAARLAQIHLDPDGAVPAIGDARWLDDRLPDIAADLLKTAAADSPLVMMEIRHVAGASARRQGATTEAVGPFVYHAVGPLGRSQRAQIDDGFARAREAWSSADAGLSPGSWLEGAASVDEALPHDALARARSIADHIDPEHRIQRSRLLGVGRT